MYSIRVVLTALALTAAGYTFGNTYVVATNGNDTASGLTGHPFRTIQRAADGAKAGDTVLVEDGLYRESVLLRSSGTGKSPIRFVAAHPGMVTVTGADPIYEWTRMPGPAPIYVTKWDHVFAIDTVNGKPVEHHPNEEPLWGRSEQVLADEKQLLPVLNLDRLKKDWAEFGNTSKLPPPLKGLGGPFAGKFSVDTSAQKMFVWLSDGSDPNQHKMLASTRAQIFGVNQWQQASGVSYVQVSGFRFQYGATFPQRPAVSLFGSHNLVENCSIDQMSGCGIQVNGVFRNSVVTGCGQVGGSACGDGFLNENDAWIGNCWKPIDRGWDAGGVKICAAKHGVFKHCLFRRNGGPGLWLDVWDHDIRITNCVFQENEGCGLFVEISHDIKADHNLAVGNAIAAVGKEAGWSDGGMVIAESEDCDFSYNTCIGNRYGIGFREQGPRDNDTDTGRISFHDARDSITHNLLVDNALFQFGLWSDNPFFGRHPSDNSKFPTEEAFSTYLKTIPEKVYDPMKQSLTVDYNLYASGSSTQKSALYGVPWRIRSRQFDRLEDLSKSTGLEAHGASIKMQPIPPALGNRSIAGWSDSPPDIDNWIIVSLPKWLSSSIHRN